MPVHDSLAAQQTIYTMIYDKNNLIEHSLAIKTHGSESRGQEEAGLHDESVSYLQVAPL